MSNQKSASFPKIDKILFTGPENEYNGFYQHFYPSLKKMCNKLVFFDISRESFINGKDLMQKRFLEFIKKEKPDFIFLWITPGEFYPETFIKIKEISPDSKIFNIFGDDDLAFEGFSRYLILFMDYGLIAQKRYVEKYMEEGNNNVFFTSVLNTDFLKPLNIKKRYDVTFIGAPKLETSGRYELIKFLKDNHIKIFLFGRGWHKYPEFKDIYKGPLEKEEMLKVLNQSRINLCFTRQDYGEPHLKGKVFEAGACKTFVLTEYCEDYLDFFEEGKELIMFRDKKEFLEKIRYYLGNEKEREKIAEAAYKKVIKNHSMNSELKFIFKKVLKNKNKRGLPKADKKIKPILKGDFQDMEELKTKLKDCDYVYFVRGYCEDLGFRKYIQSYSLQITKKPISCCDYYVSNKRLGDYLYFQVDRAFKALNSDSFNLLLNINQLMVTKEYFLENLEKFKKAFTDGSIDFINNANTAFVSFPLIRINQLNSRNYDIMIKAFSLNFLGDLYRLKDNKLKLVNYSASLFGEIIKGKKFILDSLIKILKDKDKMRTFKMKFFNKTII